MGITTRPLAHGWDQCSILLSKYLPITIITMLIITTLAHASKAFHATITLLTFGTVALPALTLYPGVLSTLPISM